MLLWRKKMGVSHFKKIIIYNNLKLGDRIFVVLKE